MRNWFLFKFLISNPSNHHPIFFAKMVKWNFPDTIKAGDSTGPMIVEFSDSTSASAFADFESPGTDQKLTVGSQHNYGPNRNNPNLWVNWFNQHVDVGFMPNGFITLTLKRPPTNRIAKMNGLNGIEISKGQ